MESGCTVGARNGDLQRPERCVKIRSGSPDHLYLAVTSNDQPGSPAELTFAWFISSDLEMLDLFDDSRDGARLLFDRIDHLYPRPHRADGQLLPRLRSVTCPPSTSSSTPK